MLIINQNATKMLETAINILRDSSMERIVLPFIMQQCHELNSLGWAHLLRVF
jgi:hypothetical protein